MIYNSNSTKPTIITAQQYGTKVSVEIDHSDTDIDELFDAFETIIVGLGYHQSSWKQWILDRADEYKEEETENTDSKDSLSKWSDDELGEAIAEFNHLESLDD
jgi:hypothetical protein